MIKVICISLCELMFAWESLDMMHEGIFMCTHNFHRTFLHSLYCICLLRDWHQKQRESWKVQIEQRECVAEVPLKVRSASVSMAAPTRRSGLGRSGQACRCVRMWLSAAPVFVSLSKDWCCHWAHLPGGWDFIHQRWPRSKGYQAGFLHHVFWD